MMTLPWMEQKALHRHKAVEQHQTRVSLRTRPRRQGLEIVSFLFCQCCSYTYYSYEYNYQRVSKKSADQVASPVMPNTE